MQHYKLLTGDVTATLKDLPADYFDAVLSDPPYGISFMGKAWDHGVPSADTYGELLRVLKPGARGLHFGGTRTFHRLAVNLEDAGFELRDCVNWLYGSGFPKSHNISKAIDKAAGAERGVIGTRTLQGTAARKNIGACSTYANGTESGASEVEVAITAPATADAQRWDGWGTALKPAWEPCLLVQKPLAGTFANNALTHGCGALNIDGCRVGDELVSTHSNGAGCTGDNGIYGSFANQQGSEARHGRFPANLILDEESGEALGEAQRFFYCAKVSTRERNAGLGDGFPVKSPDQRDDVSAGIGSEKGVAPARNHHPTLKPLALTEYLAKLLLVPARTDGQPRRLLVPFSGAGSEMIGALLAGWDEVWGIELDGEYVSIAQARIEHHTSATPLDALPLAA